MLICSILLHRSIEIVLARIYALVKFIILIYFQVCLVCLRFFWLMVMVIFSSCVLVLSIPSMLKRQSRLHSGGGLVFKMCCICNLSIYKSNFQHVQPHCRWPVEGAAVLSFPLSSHVSLLSHLCVVAQLWDKCKEDDRKLLLEPGVFSGSWNSWLQITYFVSLSWLVHIEGVRGL